MAVAGVRTEHVAGEVGPRAGDGLVPHQRAVIREAVKLAEPAHLRR